MRNLRFRITLAAMFLCLPLCMASANETRELRAIRNSVLDTVRNGHSPCPTVADPGVEEYIFAFDGAGGFDGFRHAYWNRNPRTLKSVNDMFKTSAQDLRESSNPYGNEALIWSDEKKKLHDEFLSMVSDEARGNGKVISAIGAGVKKLQMPVPKEILYFPWNSAGLAASCASRLTKLHKNAGSSVAISAIGFSLGGYTTVLFARILEMQGTRLKNVMTLDAVPYTHEVFRALRNAPNRTVIRVPDNHDSWLNLFQSQDQGALVFLLPIRGSTMSGAVRNQLAKKSGVEVREHMKVPGSDDSRSEILRMLRD